MEEFKEFLGDLFSLFTENLEHELASNPFLYAVKVIHVDDLKHWSSFKEYSEHASISFADYKIGAKKIKGLRDQVLWITKLQSQLQTLEKGDYEEYDQIKHKDEIDSIRQKLANITQEDQAKLDEIKTSRFAHPVLFISHRWEGVPHPDPEGSQYQKLSKLQNCFIIYDYSSFPQKITSEDMKDALEKILISMNKLIKNVVVLKSPNYLERGWCIYEYVLASLESTIVCDEVQDPDFVDLRNFRVIEPTQAGTLKGHSVDSGIQNGISAGVLKAVNRILPKYTNSRFSVEADRDKVTDLLRSRLVEILPQKKEHSGSPYLSEWNNVPWTRKELENAFRDEVPLEHDFSTNNVKPYVLKVPDTLEEAIANGYSLDKAPPNTQLTFLERSDALEIFAELSSGCSQLLMGFVLFHIVFAIIMNIVLIIIAFRWEPPGILSNSLVFVPVACVFFALLNLGLFWISFHLYSFVIERLDDLKTKD